MFKSIYDVIYPPRCPVCDDILAAHKNTIRPKLCKECVPKVSFITQPVCMRCGKPLESDIEEFCHDCTGKSFYFKRGVAAFSYSKAMKHSMYGFKYNNRREYGDFYAHTIWEKSGHIIDNWNCDALIPVPLHSKRQRKRGYNQATVLAKSLAGYLKLPVDEDILKRVKNTSPQKALEAKERKNNIEKAFQTSVNGIKYKKVILVDDIYTTGATIDECAKVLREAGVFEVYFITACIGNGF